MTVPTEGVFERFRRVHAVAQGCSKQKTSHFIKNHESSTEITVVRTDDVLPAVMVMNHSEGADNSLLYVYKDADIDLGDYFIWNEDYHFFILEPVIIVKDVDFKKFTALQCNVFVNDSFWAYFIGNRRSYKATSLAGGNYEVDNLQPVLVAPINEGLVINGYIKFNQQTWRILSADLDSIHGIGYYYIDRALNSRDLEADLDSLEDSDNPPEDNTIYVGMEVTVETEQAYMAATDVKVIKRTATAVTFIPQRAGDLSVTVRRNGIERTLIYDVREI